MKRRGRRQRTHPGGTRKAGGAARLKASRPPGAPSGGGGSGEGAGENPTKNTAPGRERPASGRSTRAARHRGRSQKKAAVSRLCPRCRSRPVPKPRRGRARGNRRPPDGASRPPQGARATSPAGSPQQTKGEGSYPGALPTTEGESPHTGGSFGAGGWRSGPAPASVARA